ncbi:MAG: PEP-utilizing enzyme [Actinomycetota bacterium]
MTKPWIVSTTPHEKFNFYTRANVGEVFPDPVSPLSFEWFETEGTIGGSEIGFREAYYRIGVMTPDELPPDDAVFLGVTNGYAYLNASALRMLGHRAPGMTYKDIDDAFFGDAPGVPDFEPGPGDDRPELTAKIQETFGWVLTTPDIPNALAAEAELNQMRADRPDFSAMSDREIYEWVWRTFEASFSKLFEEHIFVSFLATLPIGIITGVCEAVGRPEATLRLLAGLGDVESAAPSMAMWDLGRIVAGSDHLNGLFDEGSTGLADKLAASDHADAATFNERFAEFTYSYGARGPNEWEVRSPTWETHPDLALAAIDRMRLSPEDAAPQGRNAERAAEREALGAEIAAMIEGDPEAHGQFMAALSSSQVFMPGRERTKTNCIKLIQEVRMALQEWGKRCVAAGTWPHVNSYGLMTKSEAAQFLDDPTGWHDTLAEREQHMHDVAALQEPFILVGEGGPITDLPRRDEVETVDLVSGQSVQGVPGCPGHARGIARVVLDSFDPTALEPGDILVAPITDPSWTPLFVPAAGVVVDVGAPLSHAIIVSRELGIPCVVSATDATKIIPDGALIEVNGDTGEVSVIELPA